MAFAGRALLAALAFLVLYALAFSLVRSRWQPRAENQAVQNAIVLQTYAFEKSGSPVVLVGSSMTRRLPEDALPAGWFNLSFGGMSALEGLGIIDRIGARPNLIVVEINTLDKAPQLDWINRHTTPGFWTLQRLFPSLRNSNRPVTVALSYAQSGWRKASDWLLGPPPLEVIARRPASAEDLPEHTMARLVVEWQQRPSIEHQETFVHNLAPLMERLNPGDRGSYLSRFPSIRRSATCPRVWRCASWCRPALPAIHSSGQYRVALSAQPMEFTCRRLQRPWLPRPSSRS